MTFLASNKRSFSAFEEVLSPSIRSFLVRFNVSIMLERNALCILCTSEHVFIVSQAHSYECVESVHTEHSMHNEHFYHTIVIVSLGNHEKNAWR